MVGLDLPFKVISYAENDLIKTMYTDAAFLQKRHNLSDTVALQNYQTKASELVKDIPDAKAVNSLSFSHNSRKITYVARTNTSAIRCHHLLSTRT
ncbi:MAG: hypothetical protein ACI9LM_005047 [Alteromonadaceae bacterium]